MLHVVLLSPTSISAGGLAVLLSEKGGMKNGLSSLVIDIPLIHGCGI